MEPFIIALLVHAAIGGGDVLFNHELIAKIPSRPNAGPEEVLHSLRELVFAVLFVALSWWQWHGAAALFIAGLLLVEVLVSAVDVVVEVDTRVLPITERVAHVLLFINLGVVLTLVGQSLLAWGALPTQVVPATYGWASWVLSGLAAIAFGWSIRDGLNAMARRAGRHQVAA